MRASLREGAAWAPPEATHEWRGWSEGPYSPVYPPVAPAHPYAETPAQGSPVPRPQETALSSEALRAIYLKLPEPDVARLITEIYRLRALARRAALFADTAMSRGSDQRLDVTSKHLLAGLAAALKAEPYIADYRLPPMELQTAAASRYRPPSGYRSVAFAAMSPENEADAVARTDVKREKLFTWKLVPQPGRGDQMWRASQYRGLVVARAGDPIQARELAAKRFSADVPPGRIENPWRIRRLVRVELMDDSPFDRIEQPGVVYP